MLRVSERVNMAQAIEYNHIDTYDDAHPFCFIANIKSSLESQQTSSHVQYTSHKMPTNPYTAEKK